MVQNQGAAGNLTKKWDKTGVIIESKGYNKYTIRQTWKKVQALQACLRNHMDLSEEPFEE